MIRRLRFILRNKLMNTKRGFKNLKYWLPVIWEDLPFDWSCLFALLEHKLSQYEKHHTNATYVGWEEVVPKITKAKELCHKLSSDEYFLERDQNEEFLYELCEILKENVFSWWT